MTVIENLKVILTLPYVILTPPNVILSEAKNLVIPRPRCFTAFSMTLPYVILSEAKNLYLCPPG